jgi:hypothetical protein
MTGGGDIIGTATDHDSLVAVLRRRKAVLQLSDAVVDELAGLAAGHCNKVIGIAPVKALGRVTLSALLGVLALKLVVVEDPEQAARIGSRWQRKSLQHGRPAAFSLRQARPLVLARAARKAALARWAGVSSADRKAHSDKMNAARKQHLARKDKAA